MTICIHYARPASGQGEGEVFGLDVAVNNLLSAWFRYGTASQFICRPVDMPSFEHFKALATQAGHDPNTRCIGLDPRHPQHNLGSISVLFRPDPLTADLTWRRQQVRGRGFATCGVVHTMSGERIARAVEELCLSPSDGSDALICPSEAIRDAIKNLWGIYSDYLAHRFGKAFTCPVQTPVIPLGIDTDKFIGLTASDKRAAQRQALGVAEDDVVLLFVGRLSFATKAHPLAFWQAVRLAAQRCTSTLRVVMYGYFKPADMEKHFRALAADFNDINIDFITNSDTRFPDGLWAAGDVFVSLADNIQESFGLTPVEAMACGLPAIISDWDGYRASVREGVDGFLIPTYAPPAFAGMAIAEAYYNEENYGVSLMGAAQSTVVDIQACATAIQALADDAGKRKAFGANGRKRAQDVFDWKHIIRAYEKLWDELTQKRVGMPLPASVPQQWPATHPGFTNPWKMFEGFPTRTLSPEDRMTITLTREQIAALMQHEMNFFIPELLAPKETVQELVEVIRRAGSPLIGDILAAFPQPEHGTLWRCLGWMLKHGIAERRTA